MGMEYRESDLRYIRAIFQNPDPVVTAPEIAEELGVSQQATHNKLTSMKNRNLARKKKVGSRAVIWWLTSNGKDVYRKEYR